MKLALITEQLDLSRGGAERSTFELACALSDVDVNVTLIAAKFNLHRVKDSPFTIQQLPVSGLSRTRRWQNFGKAVAEHIQKNNYDIVHSLVPLSCADIYQPRGGSILYSLHRHLESLSSPNWARIKRLTSTLNRSRYARIQSERTLCRTPNGPLLAALSDYVARQFQTEYNLPQERIRIIPNGIKIDSLRSDTARAQGQKLRRLYDPDSNRALFLFAAENLRLKGLTPLIRAAHGLIQQRNDNLRDFRIMVVSSQKFSSWWKQAHGLGLDHHILFMGPTTCMPALLNMCDAVVLPTYNDACSRLVLESLAAGKPALTTRFNGAADFIINGKNGFIIDHPDDTTALSDALLQLCDPHLQQQFSRTIESDRLYDQVSIQRHVHELHLLYESLQ